ncbi:MAG TPA: bifunctional enoyl-CoA hydratase/phosphate acetyltransferase [Burkholderiales bacterium]|nr:bifunctional enoyl-CoA hydratase/phosphate acetyltransferase [Burkholderiales bacterium]
MTQSHLRSQHLIARARALGAIPTAVIYPCSRDALAGALQAHAAGLIAPVLIGPRAQIAAIAAAEKLDLGTCRVEDVAGPVAASQRAAAMAGEGHVEALMKGSLHTDELMSVLVSRTAGLRTARRISHVFVMDIPDHDRLLLITDAAINIAPDLRVKADIVRNAIDAAHAIGIAEPRVALLSAVETVNPDIPSTVDAAALREMAQRGEIKGGIVDGPLAFDNAISAEAARIKGISSPVSGAVDILVVPALEAGNILYKSLVYLGAALAAGVVLGTRVPVILTSRADSPASRIASAAVACLLAHQRRQEAA